MTHTKFLRKRRKIETIFKYYLYQTKINLLTGRKRRLNCCRVSLNQVFITRFLKKTIFNEKSFIKKRTINLKKTKTQIHEHNNSPRAKSNRASKNLCKFNKTILKSNKNILQWIVFNRKGFRRKI